MVFRRGDMNSNRTSPGKGVLNCVCCVALTLAGTHVGRAQVTNLFATPHPVPPSVLVNVQGTYYNDISLTTPIFTRTDSTINFNWGLGSPDPRINVDNFSVRWTGFVVPPYSGTYTFYATSDDGIRVWLNGSLIIDSWIDQAATQHPSGLINLTADTLYDFQVDYYEHSGDAVAQLAWTGPNIGYEIVGSTFYPSPAGDAFGSSLSGIGQAQYAVGAPL